ncbi:hypothetical protein J0S82_007808, partial [Galemys pyrenaicus]
MGCCLVLDQACFFLQQLSRRKKRTHFIMVNYQTLRIGGLVFAVVLFLVGILLIL